MNLKNGCPTIGFTFDNIRKIMINKDVPKTFWYCCLAGKTMLVYLFHEYADALSVSFPTAEQIHGEHFKVVKYVDKNTNTDLRFIEKNTRGYKGSNLYLRESVMRNAIR